MNFKKCKKRTSILKLSKDVDFNSIIFSFVILCIHTQTMSKSTFSMHMDI